MCYELIDFANLQLRDHFPMPNQFTNGIKNGRHKILGVKSDFEGEKMVEMEKFSGNGRNANASL